MITNDSTVVMDIRTKIFDNATYKVGLKWLGQQGKYEGRPEGLISSAMHFLVGEEDRRNVHEW